MSSDPHGGAPSDVEALDEVEGMVRPEDTDNAAPDTSPDEVEPAFDIDLDPEEQGRAGTSDEPTA